MQWEDKSFSEAALLSVLCFLAFVISLSASLIKAEAMLLPNLTPEFGRLEKSNLLDLPMSSTDDPLLTARSSVESLLKFVLAKGRYSSSSAAPSVKGAQLLETGWHVVNFLKG